MTTITETWKLFLLLPRFHIAHAHKSFQKKLRKILQCLQRIKDPNDGSERSGKRGGRLKPVLKDCCDGWTQDGKNPHNLLEQIETLLPWDNEVPEAHPQNCMQQLKLPILNSYVDSLIKDQE